ncbi:LLM class flavin-dependent oxidoreductase [Paenibacillus shunpengii]|uniref:LLM class flavin-dependent oxidoreductase n=1 Tax=Paenibacillus shunpengii TaxID=2054424 RepID=A0ABW5SPR7_9BACL
MTTESTTHKKLEEIPFSILDLATVTEGSNISSALKNSLELAQHADELGYNRFWLAEHHNMPGIASSATSVVIGHIAGGTKRIRVGSGGIMLPNHAPLVIAEQFGTLESLYPGRIDLGLGRAPGSDQLTSRALRRGPGSDGQDFPQRLEELQHYFKPTSTSSMQVHAYPGRGLDIPIWLLGSSGFSAELAARKGLPFSFASHFAPDYLLPALDYYYNNFQPSEVLEEPYAMVALNAFVAETDAEAHKLATSHQKQFLNMIRGRFGLMQPPVDELDWNMQEKAIVKGQLRYSVMGDKDSVRDQLNQMLKQTGANEFIVTSPIYDHQARLHSIKLLSEIFNQG